MSSRALFFIVTYCLLRSFNVSASDHATEHLATASFSGGCFWCMEQPFDLLPGVIATIPGYTGGDTKNPTYKQVSGGITGHVEAIQIQYDPAVISYEKLLDVFWRNIDPTDGNGQFCDKGNQYRSGIFYHNEEQKRLAEQSKILLEKNQKFAGSIMTFITEAKEFYPAEDYHQNFSRNNPFRYKFYRFTCGRDNRLNELWAKSQG
jgi:peptide-methionine (S)-S-oxide reductase